MHKEPFIAPTPDSMNQLLPAFEFVSLIMSNPDQAVYLANQKSLDRHVAIKLHSPEASLDEDFKEAVETMARQMAKLNHVNLIGVFNSGVVNDMLYLVMEFVPGKPLQQLMKAKTLEPVRVGEMIDGICSGLACAHYEGFLHGGLSPLNVLVTAEYEPKIGNFGFVTTASSDGDNVSARYIAPELGEEEGELSPFADVYSLGVLLYELYTGKPFIVGVVPPALALPEGRKVLEVIKKATVQNPEQRYPGIDEFHSACMKALPSRKGSVAAKSKAAAQGPKGPPRGVSKPYTGRKPQGSPRQQAGRRPQAGPKTFVVASTHGLSREERRLKTLLRFIIFVLVLIALYLAWNRWERKKMIESQELPSVQRLEVIQKEIFAVSFLKVASQADTDARC